MNDLRATIVRGAFRIMESRQFVRLFQDERVQRALIEWLSLPARARCWVRSSGAAAARTLGLATVADLRALEQHLVSRMETQKEE